MKFGKELQKAIDMSDPDWGPYWPNYKVLKRLIKGLDARAPVPVLPIVLVPFDNPRTAALHFKNYVGLLPEKEEVSVNKNSGIANQRQSQGYITVNVACEGNGNIDDFKQGKGEATSQRPCRGNAASTASPAGTTLSQFQTLLMLRRHPGEVVFFKLLHVEVNKASHFFDQTKRELQAREARLEDDRNHLMERKQDAGDGSQTDQMQREIVAHRARVQQLHQVSLRLETFAIMTYCGLSKILKKHDRATGFATQKAFMINVVSPANFTSYPWLLVMLEKCERWMLECCHLLDTRNKSHHHRTNSGAQPDEARLFLDMIQRINLQRKRTQEELTHDSDDSSCAGSKDVNHDDDTLDGDHHSGALPERLPLKKRLRRCP